MNTQLVKSLAKIILSLSDEEKELLNQQINEETNNIAKQMKDLEEKLKYYETKYKMSSPDFYKEFRQGKLGDDIDFFEWSVFYEMLLSAKQELNILV